MDTSITLSHANKCIILYMYILNSTLLIQYSTVDSSYVTMGDFLLEVPFSGNLPTKKCSRLFFARYSIYNTVQIFCVLLIHGNCPGYFPPNRSTIFFLKIQYLQKVIMCINWGPLLQIVLFGRQTKISSTVFLNPFLNLSVYPFSY
jgi:hypothetical protein